MIKGIFDRRIEKFRGGGQEKRLGCGKDAGLREKTDYFRPRLQFRPPDQAQPKTSNDRRGVRKKNEAYRSFLYIMKKPVNNPGDSVV